MIFYKYFKRKPKRQIPTLEQFLRWIDICEKFNGHGPGYDGMYYFLTLTDGSTYPSKEFTDSALNFWKDEND